MKSATKPSSKLKPMQLRFAAEYGIDLNATQAAIRAGYSARTAKSQGQRLLTNAHIAKAIADAQNARAARTEITADRVLKELARIAFFDIGKAFTPDGALKPLDEMDEDTRRALAGLEVVSLTEDGEHIGTLKKVKIADKLAALEKIGRHLGMWNDKLTLKGDSESPLVALIQHVQGNALKPVKAPPKDSENDE
jgi:phage terminase small subunit